MRYALLYIKSICRNVQQPNVDIIASTCAAMEIPFVMRSLRLSAKKNSVHHQFLLACYNLQPYRKNLFKVPTTWLPTVISFASTQHPSYAYFQLISFDLSSSPSLSLIFVPSMIFHLNSCGFFIICYQRTQASTSSSNFAPTTFHHRSEFSSTTSSKIEMLEKVATRTFVRCDKATSVTAISLPREQKRSLFTSKT